MAPTNLGAIAGYWLVGRGTMFATYHVPSWTERLRRFWIDDGAVWRSLEQIRKEQDG
jgi:hypothetical protein